VDERVIIDITWSSTHPEMAGRHLSEIAEVWNVTQIEAAKRLQPAGAIYHSILEDDMRRILSHPATMIGSDGLPNDSQPHPRLWGAFPRVLGRYCREQNLFSLPEAIYKMTAMTAERFAIPQRGRIREGYYADLVLFDPERIIDMATFDDPMRPAVGIQHVWVNGSLAYTSQGLTGSRNGRFLPRGKVSWIE
jgi:N-acyl-D-amino-acid deacylase